MHWIVCVLMMGLGLVCNGQNRCGPREKCTCFGSDESRNTTINCSKTRIPLKEICEYIGLRNNANVTTLVSSENEYEYLRDEVLRGCEKLIGLILDKNKISKIESRTFERSKYLVLLDMSNNWLNIYNNNQNNPCSWNLTNLVSLKINWNIRNYESSTYPDLSCLPHLKTLAMDGLANIDVDVGNFTGLLEHLDMSGHCSIPVISRSLFSRITSIKSLNISNCNISSYEFGALTSLTKLDIFDISFNLKLGFKYLHNITHDLQFTNIKVFNYSKVHNTFGLGTVLRKADICFLRNTSLIEIVLDSNRLQLFETNSGILFPDTLETVRVNDNRLSYGPYFLQSACVTNGKEFYGSNQHTVQNPFVYQLENYDNNFAKCEVDAASPCPFMSNESLRKISEGKKGCKFFESENTGWSFPTLPKTLKKIVYRDSGLKLAINTFILKTSSMTFDIEYVDVSGNVFYSWEGPLNMFSKAKYIDLSNTFCSKISPNFFTGLSSLKNLQIQQNFIGIVLREYCNSQSIFQDLSNLEILNMSDNRISLIPPSTFVNLTLLKTLDLSSNNIEEWTADVTTMYNLAHLNLSSNPINTLPVFLLNHLESVVQRLNVSFSLDLQNNNIKCICQNKAFLEWIVKHKSNMVGYGKYLFFDEDGHKLDVNNFENQVQLLQKRCSSYTVVIVISSIMISVFISVLIGAFVYKNRWKLRYLLYMSKQKYFGSKGIPGYQALRNFKYDAFISYADENIRFIKDGIIPNLEHRGLQLCIHQRDFQAGNNVADNIIDAIQASKRTVVILTKFFLKSKWCMYEFNMARMESIYSRSETGCLLVVMYEDVPSKLMPLELLSWIKQDSYLEYANETLGEIVFLDKLRDAISA